MSDYGELIAPGAIRFTRLLPGPIERVWAYLVEPDKRAKWFAGGPMDLREGGKVELEFRHSDLSAEPPPPEAGGYESTETAEVVRIDPPRLLVLNWHDVSGGEAGYSVVAFELAQQGDKVLLTLTNSRIAGRGNLVSVGGGWHAHLGVLEDVLEGREPRFFWQTYHARHADYDQRIAKD